MISANYHNILLLMIKYQANWLIAHSYNINQISKITRVAIISTSLYNSLGQFVYTMVICSYIDVLKLTLYFARSISTNSATRISLLTIVQEADIVKLWQILTQTIFTFTTNWSAFTDACF